MSRRPEPTPSVAPVFSAGLTSDGEPAVFRNTENGSFFQLPFEVVSLRRYLRAAAEAGTPFAATLLADLERAIAQVESQHRKAA